ncbi:phage antirepressor KilAC domain-containing protein [Pseudomonas aeruginosa]|uniref:phage antirepressor KilAC domain-containing protein n=1 Tax=Pseudomonas aeruginosa TaxID=287 RepID=UPI000EAF7618|nr:phage antirepressor KilAC domain-containing protein [Pseudomonas aeruginosa]
MTNTIQIHRHTLPIVEFRGQRVVTLAMIDQVHERPSDTAGRNFREHRHRFIEGEDYFQLARSQNHEIQGFGLEVPNRGLIVLTEQGYLMIVKSLQDDLAWEVQRQLVNNYFRKPAPSVDVAAMLSDPTTLKKLLLENVSKVEQLTADNDDLQHENQMLEQKVVADAPKVAFHDGVATSVTVHSVREVAQNLGTGRNRLFAFLREKRWLDRHNVPYQAKIEAGYLVAEPSYYEDEETGEKKTKFTAKVTGKGYVKIQELWAQRETEILETLHQHTPPSAGYLPLEHAQ